MIIIIIEKKKAKKPINQIYKYIIKSTETQTKVSTKQSLIDDLSKRLLELQIKSNHSIKIKHLKWIVKNILPNYKKRKVHNQK